MTQLQQQRRWWHPMVKTLASKRPVIWIISRTLHHVDRMVIRMSGGKQTAATILTGMPIVTMTTTGAKSGRPRSVPLMAIPDGEKLVFIASNWGQQTHPSWYHNMRANPQVSISKNGWSEKYLAHEAAGVERELYWHRAVDAYAGYAAYEQRTNDRAIPVMVCTPYA